MTQDLKCEVLPAGDKVNPHTTNEINTIASFLNLQKSFNRKEWINQINPLLYNMDEKVPCLVYLLHLSQLDY